MKPRKQPTRTPVWDQGRLTEEELTPNPINNENARPLQVHILQVGDGKGKESIHQSKLNYQ